MLFDYESLAQSLNLSPGKLDQIRVCIRKDFPDDEMMFELHMLRVLMALKRKDVSFKEIVQAYAGNANKVNE